VKAVKGYEQTALQQAASGGCKAVLKLLQHHKADINATGGEDSTALLRAELQRYVEIAELLLKHDKGGSTVHHTTSANDTPDL
jgi:ankyrin repeat protein